MKRRLFSLKRCLFSLKRHLFEAKRRLFNCFHPRQTFLSPRPDHSFTYRRHISHHWMMPIVIRYRQFAAQVPECEDMTHLQAKCSLVVLQMLFAICATRDHETATMKNRASAIEALMYAYALRLRLGSASIYASPYLVSFICRRHEKRLRVTRKRLLRSLHENSTVL